MGWGTVGAVQWRCGVGWGAVGWGAVWWEGAAGKLEGGGMDGMNRLHT